MRARSPGHARALAGTPPAPCRWRPRVPARRPGPGRPRAAGSARPTGTRAPPVSGGCGSRPAPRPPIAPRYPTALGQSSARSYPSIERRSSSAARGSSPRTGAGPPAHGEVGVLRIVGDPILQLNQLVGLPQEDHTSVRSAAARRSPTAALSLVTSRSRSGSATSGGPKSTSVAASARSILGCIEQTFHRFGIRPPPARPWFREGQPRSDLVGGRFHFESRDRPNHLTSMSASSGLLQHRHGRRCLRRSNFAHVILPAIARGLPALEVPRGRRQPRLSRERPDIEACIQEDEVAPPGASVRGVGFVRRVPCLARRLGGFRTAPAISNSPAIFASCSSASSSREAARSNSTSIIRIS